MTSILNCIRDQHDLRLLCPAIAVCVFGSWIGIKTFSKARRAVATDAWVGWVGISTLAIAATEWATHFLAMLAYKPGYFAKWDVGLSIGSFLVALIATLLGLLLGSQKRLPASPEIGGAVMGTGLAAMHFIGMKAFEVQGRIVWDDTKVATSVLLGILFCTLALSRPSRPVTQYCRYGGALCLVIGILGLHMTAMAAAEFAPDPSIVVASTGIPDIALAIAVGAVTMPILGCAYAAFLLENHILEAADRRMQRLANATSDGLIIVRAGKVSDANTQFVELIGRSVGSLRGVDPSALWTFHPTLDQVVPSAFETELLGEG